jgi:hypothetical protein
MSDPVTGDGQSRHHRQAAARAVDVRIRATPTFLPIGGGSQSGWSSVSVTCRLGLRRGCWPPVVLAWSYRISSTPGAFRIAAWLQPVARGLTGIMGLCVLVMVACGYLLVLIAPFQDSRL